MINYLCGESRDGGSILDQEQKLWNQYSRQMADFGYFVRCKSSIGVAASGDLNELFVE